MEKVFCLSLMIFLFSTSTSAANLKCSQVSEVTSLESAKIVRAGLSDIEFQLQQQIDALDFAVFQRGTIYTAEERDHRQTLRTEQSNCRDQLVILSYKTLQFLDRELSQ